VRDARRQLADRRQLLRVGTPCFQVFLISSVAHEVAGLEAAM